MKKNVKRFDCTTSGLMNVQTRLQTSACPINTSFSNRRQPIANTAEEPVFSPPLHHRYEPVFFHISFLLVFFSV